MINETLDAIVEITREKNIVERWEYLKFRIREVSQEFARNNAQEINLIISQLSEHVHKMEEKLQEVDIELLEKTKMDPTGIHRSECSC